MTIIERYMSSQKGHGGICAFELKCAGVVWLILAAVFLTYWNSFFLGNHDFRFIRYGVPLNAGVLEGRFTQFLPIWLLTGGHILPAFNVLLGFAFFALAAVRLAEWYGLSERYRDVLPFTLLIVLNPYVLTQLYYVHQILSIFVWHFLCVWGVIWIDRAVLATEEGKKGTEYAEMSGRKRAAGCAATDEREKGAAVDGRKKAAGDVVSGERDRMAWSGTTDEGKKAAGYAAAGMPALFVSLGGYTAALELVLTIYAGKFWLDILRAEKSVKVIFRHYLKLGAGVMAALLCYAAVIWEMKRRNLIFLGMYNVQTLPLRDMPEKFLQRWHKPWEILYSVFPYEVPLAGYGFLLLAVAALAASLGRRKFLWGALCLIVSVYLAFFLAFITPHDFFDTFRIHFFSVPYLTAVLFVIAFSCGGNGSRNLALAVAAVMMCVYIRTDIYAQKIWLLGNRQDELYVERIKQDLLPRLKPGKKYRLTTLGGLYGREKFAGISTVYSLRTYERDRELFRAPMYVSVMFSSGFFLSEPESPIWGDAMYLGGGIFYGITPENIMKGKRLDAEIFARTFGLDKEAQLDTLKIMMPYPAADYCFVGEKDIFLMMPQVRYDRETLAGIIQEELTKNTAIGEHGG